MWDKLSMADRAKYIKLGVLSGIYDINSIRECYNRFEEGGYTRWKEKIKLHKDIDIDKDATYDYEGFYNSDPDRAWDMLNKESDAHFTDEYKTALHPSFSNQSIYSGHKNKFNPNGITGGTWIDDNHYQLSQSQFDSDWDTDATLDYFDWAESSPVHLYAPDGAIMLRGVSVTPKASTLNRNSNKFEEGGPKRKKNYVLGKLNDEGQVVPDYSKKFGTKEELNNYMKAYNMELTFVEDLPELVVKSPELIKLEEELKKAILEEMANWTPSDLERYARMAESTGWKNTDFAYKAIKAELKARQAEPGAILALAGSGLNVLSPSTLFGAIVDWALGEKGYWEGIGGGNSGFVTDNFAKEHPYYTAITNTAADALIGMAGLDVLDLATGAKHLMTPRGLTQNAKAGVQNVKATIANSNKTALFAKNKAASNINKYVVAPIKNQFLKLKSHVKDIPIDYDALIRTGKIIELPGSKYVLRGGSSNNFPLKGANIYKRRNFFFDKKYNFEKIVDDIINGDAPSGFTDLMWDDYFNFTINAKDPLLKFKLRDRHFTLKSGEPADIWYHGTSLSNHAIFDSSVRSATIGGESAFGKIKGNFLTKNVEDAAKYANGYGHTSLYILRVLEELKQKGINRLQKKYSKALDQAAPIHPSEKGRLNLKDMHTYTLSPTKLMEKLKHYTLSGIYPLYVKAGKTLKLDFKGNPWSKSPYKFPPKYRLIERWSEFDPKSGKLIEKIKEGPIILDLNKLTDYIKELNLPKKMTYLEGERHYRPCDRSLPKSEYTNEAIYLKHGPSYSATIETVDYPSTTNGAVQYGASEGYNTIKITNVVDPNPGMTDLVPLKSSLMKLAVPITYDDLGNIIPLSKRDNFDILDIRYKYGGQLKK